MEIQARGQRAAMTDLAGMGRESYAGLRPKIRPRPDSGLVSILSASGAGRQAQRAVNVVAS